MRYYATPARRGGGEEEINKRDAAETLKTVRIPSGIRRSNLVGVANTFQTRHPHQFVMRAHLGTYV